MVNSQAKNFKFNLMTRWCQMKKVILICKITNNKQTLMDDKKLFDKKIEVRYERYQGMLDVNNLSKIEKCISIFNV